MVLPAPGDDAISARYDGSYTVYEGISPATNVTVSKATPIDRLTSSANPASSGALVSFTATVAGAGAVPTGPVTFLDGTTQLGAATLIAGVANLSTSTLSAGSHSITASYSGDTNYSPVTSQVLTQVIGGVTPANPVFSVPAGVYNTAQSVSITTTTAGAVIHYTVDGTTPTAASPVYSTPIAVSASETVEAVAFATGGGQSAVVSATYIINSASKIDFGGGFAGANGPMQLNGTTAIAGTALRLTDGGGNEAGTAFYATPINIQSFTSDFTFQITEPVGDGFTFTIQNAGPTALGGAGAGLGYTSIGKSVAVKFDLYNNAGEGPNSTGVFTSGNTPRVPAINLAGTGIDLHSGDAVSVHMTYNIGYSGDELTMTLTDQKTSAVWTNSFAIDIPAAVGRETAYVGFTGGTGGGSATQEILAWTFVPGTAGK